MSSFLGIFCYYACNTLKIPNMNMKKPKDSQKKSSEAAQNNADKNTKIKHNTGERPEKDTNPLPPNPNKVDNHSD
ncbi:hypothetical protein GCM10011418_34810 [Sphingobacterium alkalisoli]|nr:hypothetical protein GCM10011418_34810 [Sphingobacterium alkalisoli]